MEHRKPTHVSIESTLAKIGDYVVFRDGQVGILDTDLTLAILQSLDLTDHVIVPFPRVFRTAWECEAYLKRN